LRERQNIYQINAIQLEGRTRTRKINYTLAKKKNKGKEKTTKYQMKTEEVKREAEGK